MKEPWFQSFRKFAHHAKHTLMAGHSKWANIKHRKAAQDAKRSKMFTKYIKEVTVAAKVGGTDEEMNARLRLAVQTAKKNNVPKDAIKRAISRAESKDAEDYIETTYEGYGPGGIAVIVECQTDNINRTVANVRSYFNKGGGNLGTANSVAYMFERKGVFEINAEGKDLEELELKIIDAGAEDIDQDGNWLTITTEFEDFGNVNGKLEDLGIETETAEVRQIPANEVALDVEQAQKVLKLVDTIEDDDDVQKVFHNLEMTDELADALEAEE